MLGVGPQEIAIIALFALIIFGPGKMPEMMREAGKYYAKFKGMADDMTGELNKVTADARKELDGAFGDLGPMGADLEKSLGMGKSSRTTSSGTKSTASSAAKKTTSTAKKTTTSSARPTATGNKTTSGTKTTTSATAATKTASKPLVATKSDPLADFALFEGEKKVTTRRARVAAPSAISDLTPRDIFGDAEPQVAEKTPLADLASSDDPVARARARRQSAGYARA